METIGLTEAKIDLPKLLERVAQGAEFTITDHGKPVARLLPPLVRGPRPDVREVLREFKAFQKGNTLGEGLTVRDLIEEGRRS